MQDNNIFIDTKTREIIKKDYDFLGVLGENNITKLIFELNEHIQGTAILEIQKDFDKYYIGLESFGKVYILDIKNSLLSDCKEIMMQLHITTENQEIFKSKIFSMKVFDEIHATEEIPEEYAEWIDIANAKLSLIDTKIEEINQLEIRNEEAIENIQDLTEEYNLNAADKIVEFNVNASNKAAELEDIKDTAEDLVRAVTFSHFEADLDLTGRMYVITPDKMGNAGFSIDPITGRLEVEFNG